MSKTKTNKKKTSSHASAAPAEGGKPASQDGMSRAAVAAIFGRIAEFEVEESDADYFKAKKIELDKPAKESLHAQASAFIEELYSNATSSEGDPAVSEKKDVGAIFQAELASLCKIQAELVTAVSEHKRQSRKMHWYVVEKNKLLESIDSNTAKSKALQETCRSLQKKTKTTEEGLAVLQKEECDKTEKLMENCESSICDVIKSVEAEEASIEEKRKENADLRQKISDFATHLELREKQYASFKRAEELQKQIADAKKAQVANYAEQNAMRADDYKRRLDAQEQKLVHLAEQGNIYNEKFKEFEKMLEETKDMAQMFNDKKEEKSKLATEIEEKNRKVLAKADARHQEINKIRERKVSIQNEIEKLKAELAAEEKTCRVVQAQRMTVMKALEENRKAYSHVVYESEQVASEERSEQLSARASPDKSIEKVENMPDLDKCCIRETGDTLQEKVITPNSTSPTSTQGVAFASPCDHAEKSRASPVTLPRSDLPPTSKSPPIPEGSQRPSGSSSGIATRQGGSSSSSANTPTRGHRSAMVTPASPAGFDERPAGFS